MPKFLTPSTNLPTFRLVTVTTFVMEKPSKISSQSPRSNQKSSDRFHCYCLINLWYDVQKTFPCFPTTENLNLCQKKFLRVCFGKKTDFSSFSRNDLWNKLFHAALNSRPTSLFIAGFPQLIRSASLTFLLCHRCSFWITFKFSQSMSYACWRSHALPLLIVKALVLRMSLILSQPCLEPFISKSRGVVNMSSSVLTETQKSVLEKGLNFAPAPTNVPKIEIVAAIESVLRKMGNSVNLWQKCTALKWVTFCEGPRLLRVTFC